MNFTNFIDETQIPEVIYLAAMLTRESQKHLFEMISSLTTVAHEWKKLCHHMTIKFKPTKIPQLGQDVTLVVTEYAVDEKGIAVKVEPNADLHLPPEQIPHITVAVSPGTPPVYSNELLRKSDSIKMPNPLILQAFIGVKTKKTIFPERKDVAYESF